MKSIEIVKNDIWFSSDELCRITLTKEYWNSFLNKFKDISQAVTHYNDVKTGKCVRIDFEFNKCHRNEIYKWYYKLLREEEKESKRLLKIELERQKVLNRRRKKNK